MIYKKNTKKIDMDFSKISNNKFELNGTKHFFIVGDCMKKMKKISNKSVDLIITDPPYNVGLNYEKYRDNLKKEAYIEWCKLWITECVRILKKTGNMFLINYPENNAYLMPFIDKLDIHFKRWLTWHYPINIGHSKKNFTRSQRSILFYSKSKNHKFYRSQILQPYKNPESNKIKKQIKLGKKGRMPYDALKLLDIFEIQNNNNDFFEINIVKNVSKYGNGKILNHPCVLPKGLIKVLIKSGSKKGDTVFDPFSGTFTVSLASAELGRNSVGIDLNSRYVKIGLQRLRQLK